MSFFPSVLRLHRILRHFCVVLDTSADPKYFVSFHLCSSFVLSLRHSPASESGDDP